VFLPYNLRLILLRKQDIPEVHPESPEELKISFFFLNQAIHALNRQTALLAKSIQTKAKKPLLLLVTIFVCNCS